MDGKIHIVQRGDAFTAAELKEMRESRPFNVYAARIDRMIEEQRCACERAGSLGELQIAQGALTALRRVREIPGILIGEMERRT